MHCHAYPLVASPLTSKCILCSLYPWNGKVMASNVVFVAGGQCGNQLGYTLLSNISTHLKSDASFSQESDVFFRGQKNRRARCVCLDTEPKAGMILSVYLSIYLSSIPSSSTKSLTGLPFLSLPSLLLSFLSYKCQSMKLWQERNVRVTGLLIRDQLHIDMEGPVIIGH